MIRTETIRTKISTDPSELCKCLRKVLYVPREEFKERIIGILVDYITEKRKDPSFIVNPIIAYRNTTPLGFVNCMVHPDYRTYNRKAFTFGWLSYGTPEVCGVLMGRVEGVAKDLRYRRIRGNINFPKGLGGIGFQTSGFEHPPLYGVAFNSADVEYLSDLKTFGYAYESEYSCLWVDAKNWDKGIALDPSIEFRYRSFENIGDILPEANSSASR